MTYERPNISSMTGYVPGEQPDAADVVKLNTNENPYPPGEAVMAALASMQAESLRRYPNPTARAFREAAAKAHNVSPDNIIPTNGGDELLRLLITTFVDPKQVIGYAEPSYSLYPVLAAAQDAKVFRIPLDNQWQLPADYVDKLHSVDAKLAFIVNPHAPSGRLSSINALSEIARNFKGVLVIDEAYVDFVDPDLAHDCVELIRSGEHDNIVLLRSLSKGYSLAGLRFGYGIGCANLVEPMLTKTRDSYNTDAVSQALATAAITHREQAARTWAAVRAERERVTAALAELGFEVPNSQSNFVLATHGDAAALYEKLKQQQIFVRYFDADRLRDKLRITIGTSAQNDALLAALKEML
jgi:histidinol-phosphate aminotransferase